MEQASLDQLDAYREALYEDSLEIKIAACRKILLLTLDMKNIEELLNHGTTLNKTPLSASSVEQ